MADGSGYGYGYGDGSGYGYGYGDGATVAALGEYAVHAIVTPWGRAARVGCQVHGLDTWRERWSAVAHEHGLDVSDEEVARLIALIEAAPLGAEWDLASEEVAHGGE